jgi:hypothetical protein
MDSHLNSTNVLLEGYNHSTGKNKGIIILNMVKNCLQYLLSKVRSHSLLGFNTEWNNKERSIYPPPPPKKRELVKIPNVVAAENPSSCN